MKSTFLSLLSLLGSNTQAFVEGLEPFWLSADLLNVEWRKGCLTTAGCADPRFKIIKSNIVSNEKISISWPVTQDIVQDHSRSFTSHWKKGLPSDLTIGCEVAGIDPTYGFPRICDSTPNIRIFAKSDDEETAKVRLRRSVQSQQPIFKEGKMLVELKGKCFNATLAVEKHESRCPWCPDHAEVAVVEQYEPDIGPDLLQQFSGKDQLIYVALALLSGISIVASAGFACLFISYLREKRASKIITNKHRLYHEQPNHIVHPLRAAEPDESRYETPWESNQQYHPLPYYRLGNRSDLTVSSPIETSSVIATSISDHGCPPKGTFGTSRRVSPNSSMGERHDDSGLESV